MKIKQREFTQSGETTHQIIPSMQQSEEDLDLNFSMFFEQTPPITVHFICLST